MLDSFYIYSQVSTVVLSFVYRPCDLLKNCIFALQRQYLLVCEGGPQPEANAVRGAVGGCVCGRAVHAGAGEPPSSMSSAVLEQMVGVIWRPHDARMQQFPAECCSGARWWSQCCACHTKVFLYDNKRRGGKCISTFNLRTQKEVFTENWQILITYMSTIKTNFK